MNEIKDENTIYNKEDYKEIFNNCVIYQRNINVSYGFLVVF